MEQTTITLYTRKSCPLCDKAKDTLLELNRDWDFTLEEIDIESSDDLTEQYGLMIPVVYIDGVEAGFGVINKFDIGNRLQEKKANLNS
ncbi:MULTISPECIES: glutaredoxin family protein [Neobacillus]|jgi:glutaredoxin|uniref:glutaredoxin family protein n=1 Tax=Neobacillus TaxID=2675232 RepID=UPI000BF36D85|nr:glutaredoxin family protein [Neobacillus sp. OS1-33]PEQ95995.1 NrdH-redoxin [Bacillus sp. AFS006103]WML24971.1 glutaredoxin family protein [Neobacillus sp. OS1-33]